MRPWPGIFLALAFLAAWSTVYADDSPFRDAIQNNDIKRVRYLTEHGPPNIVNQKLKHEATPLHLAAALNRSEICKHLIDSGAEIDARTDNGFTALHWAASRNALETAKLLISRRANIAATNDAGITPLHWAARNNATNVVHLLIEAGADPETRTNQGLTPLHWAVRDNANEAGLILATVKELRLLRTGNARPSPHKVPPVVVPRLERATVGKPFAVPFPESITIEFIWIEPLKTWVAKYEITNAQFMTFKPDHVCDGPGEFDYLAADLPAARVSWNDAAAFCGWMTAQYGAMLPEDHVFRLPSVAEWEAFAACGDERRFPWGNRWPPRYGNYADASGRTLTEDWQGIQGYNDGFPATCPVEKSGRNKWGLFGVGGNVWEWCIDWHDADRVFKSRRGGGWYFDTKPLLEISAKGFDRPDGHYINNGFRVIAAPKR